MNGFSCTSHSWTSLDGKHFLGRTYDMFGNLDANRIAVIDKGYLLSLDPEGKRKIPVNHALAAMCVTGTTASPVFVDGINDSGLMVCLLNFPGFGHFNTNRSDGSTDIYPGSLAGFLLGTCSSVEEACEAVKHVNLTDEKVYGSIMSVHYILSDSTGETVIIEPDEGGISIHRNTIGVMANSPGYLWQKMNLRNYVSVSNIHTPPVRICEEEFSTFGNGTGGSAGLPGDYSSPSRFVRMALIKNFAPRGRNEEEAVTRMFHNFATVDVPRGFLKERADKEEYEMTLCTCVMCSESRSYYFSPYNDRRISAIRLDDASGKTDDRLIRYISLPSCQDIKWIE